MRELADDLRLVGTAVLRAVSLACEGYMATVALTGRKWSLFIHANVFGAIGYYAVKVVLVVFLGHQAIGGGLGGDLSADRSGRIGRTMLDTLTGGSNVPP
jgi:hypothetical protein